MIDTRSGSQVHILEPHKNEVCILHSILLHVAWASRSWYLIMLLTCFSRSEMCSRRPGQVARLRGARQGRLVGVRRRASTQSVALAISRSDHCLWHTQQLRETRHVPRRPGVLCLCHFGLLCSLQDSVVLNSMTSWWRCRSSQPEARAAFVIGR